nr:MAG: late protein 1 [Ailuropoda melanoleuca papillomavirus 5]
MAVWLPAQNRFYLPPQPTTKVLNTEDYVTRTSIYYHTSSGRLLTVGHPFWEILSDDQKNVLIPKVSPNQYRVFRLLLPDPNNFAFGDKSLFNPETERLVWGVKGIEIDRGQPLGLSVTGSSLYDKNNDVENPNRWYPNEPEKDARVNLAFDPKQTQMFILGCKPAVGEHWIQSRKCEKQAYDQGQCPAIELKNSTIEDGDMVDIGFGAMDFNILQKNRSGVPLDINDTVCKYPDYIKMANDPYGDSSFFFVRREQMYARHFFTKSGKLGKETVPEKKLLKRKEDPDKSGTTNYFCTPSGSLVSTEGQLFNRPYWIQRSQGQNNGIAWQNQLFLTVVDNTRGTLLNINVENQNVVGDDFEASKYNSYLRHVEEFDISLILQLCKVKLTPENLALIHTMNAAIIEDWHLNVIPPTGSLDEAYRFINSLATKCPENAATTEKTDPYGTYKFWEVNLTEKMTEQLDQTNLGRKFLFQTNVLSTRGLKRARSVSIKTKAKRKKSSK